MRQESDANHRRRPSDALRDPVGQRLRSGRQPASGRLAQGPRRLSGRPASCRTRQSAADPRRPERRRIRRREPARAHPRAARPRRLRQADRKRGLRLRPDRPFGIAFYPPGPDPQWVYVGETAAVVRFPYATATSRRAASAEVIVPDIPSGGHLQGGGHWTRDVAFSPDGKKMFVSVGSRSNDFENPTADETIAPTSSSTTRTARASGSYACGIRNPVGLAVNPTTGQLWTLGERARRAGRRPGARLHHARGRGRVLRLAVVLHRAQPGPAPPGKHPELEDKVDRPDVLIQSHSASLDMVVLRRAASSPTSTGRCVRGRARLLEPRAGARATR